MTTHSTQQYSDSGSVGSGSGLASGFSLVAIVIVIVALGIVGFVGWRLWDSNQKDQGIVAEPSDLPAPDPNPNPNPNSQPPQTTDPNEGYVVIKEWGVRFKAGETTKNLSYRLGSSNQESFAYLSTSRLLEIAENHPECKDAHESISLARAKPGDNNLGSPWQESDLAKIGVKVDDYYYYASSGQPCFGQVKPEILSEVESIRKELRDAIRTVERAY